MKLLLVVLGLWLLLPVSALASASSLSLTVEPVYYLVVNADHQIMLVVTNTGDEPPPIVRLDRENGPVIPYSADIQARYFALHALIDFSFTGVVYELGGARLPLATSTVNLEPSEDNHAK